MKNKRFFNNIFSIILIILVIFGLSGCSPEYLRSYAQSAYDRGDYLYAIGCYKGILLQQPDDINAYYGLGNSYLYAGDIDRAAEYYDKVLFSNKPPASPLKEKIYLTLGDYYHRNKEYEKSFNVYNAAAGLNSKNQIPIELFDRLDKNDDFFGTYKNTTPSNDQLSMYYRITSYIYARKHDYNNSANMSIKAIENYPDNELAYYLLGYCSGQKGQYEKSLESFKKAISKATDKKEYLPMYITQAYFLSKNGQYNEARVAYNNITNNINLSDVLNDYSSLNALVLAQYNSGMYDDALYSINKFINSGEKAKTGLFLRDSSTLRSSYGDKSYYILDVIKGSSAEEAGLQFGDKIIEVNNVSTKGWPVEKLVETLSGTEGTKVTVKIQRNARFAKFLSKDKPKKDKSQKDIFERTLTRKYLKNDLRDKELANIYAVRSLIYRAKGDINKASADVEKAYSLYPNSVNTMLAYGLSNIDKGNYKEALNILSKIQPRMIENERLYSSSNYFFFIPFPSDEEQLKIGKAIAYAKLGRINEAVSLIPESDMISQLPPINSDYRKLSQIFNQIAEIHTDKAVYFQMSGDLRKALDEYTTAVAFNKDETKNKELKNNIFNIARQLPGLPPISEDTRKHMIRAEVLLAENDFQGCLNEYQNAMKSAPYLPKLYYNTAMVYGNMKNYDKAISYMNNYIDLAPEAPNVQDAKDEITKWELLQEKSGKSGL